VGNTTMDLQKLNHGWKIVASYQEFRDLIPGELKISASPLLFASDRARPRETRQADGYLGKGQRISLNPNLEFNPIVWWLPILRAE
jgi:hypothetical protein